MNQFFRRSLIVGAAAAISLTLGLSPARAITNGTYDDNDHPNVGIMYFNDLPFTLGFASGSLLSAQEFLTAGHVTATLTAYGVTPGQVSVSFDAHVSLSPERVISTAEPIAVTGWVTHPGWWCNAAICRNDVGVIHLAESVSVTPIDLPEVGFLDTEAAGGGLRGHAFVNVGYGFNSVDRYFYGPTANRTWEQRRMASSTEFTALTPHDLQQLGGGCFGDSGGPHFYGGDYPNLVVAVGSYGDPTCTALEASERLDTQAVHDFLELYR
jgi:hypothetical protein